MKINISKIAAVYFILQCLVVSQALPKGFAALDPIDQEEEQLEQDIKLTNTNEDQELNRFAGLAGEIKAGEFEEAQLTQAENQREQDDMMDAEEHDEDRQDLIDDRLH